MPQDNKQTGNSRVSRRSLLKAGAIVTVAGLSGAGLGTAQSEEDFEIEQNAEDEYVIIRNISDEEVDITGYHLNIEAEEGSETNQIRQLEGEVIIGSGEEIIVAVGGLDVPDADVQFVEPYQDERLANDGSDVVALLDENQNFVAASDDSHQYNGDGDGDDGTDDGDDDAENHTLTVIVTDVDGQRIEGADVGVVTYDGGVDVGTGTTDECGEVQFEVEDGAYEISTGYEELAQSSANRLIGVDGEDATLIINLFEPNEEEAPTEEEDIVEPEPCEAGEEEDEEPTDDDDEDPGDRGDTDTDDDGDDDEEDMDEDAAATSDEKEEKDEKDDDCPEQ